ncbi:hypothetical protein GCM10009840_29320 [Pseudolysinimonas kribbensis]|uniref:GlcG/HbpS family heme-binding protein n=1 Tax=Pseudolysinimonas kribbensis TaxID=433641 RepID=UPI0031E2B726
MPVVTLARAEAILDAALAEAARHDLAVSAAVVDAGGHLVAFRRMDGAEIAGPALAVDKAYTAIALSGSTADLAAEAQPGGALFGIQSTGGGRFVVFGGGVPVRDGDLIVGGVGVSGAPDPAVDDACARAGAAAFG